MSEFRANRVLSRPLTALLMKTSLTPNQITLLSTALGIAAGWLFSQGRYETSLGAAAAYQLAVVLDNCDGEVARAKNMRSKLGGWLDIFGDITTDLALWIGLAIGVKKQGLAGPVDLFLALCVGGAVLHCLLVIFEKIKGFGPAVFEAPHPEHENRRNIVLDLFDAFREGEASWFVLFFAVLGHADWIFWAGGVYMPALFLSAAVINFKWLVKK